MLVKRFTNNWESRRSALTTHVPVPTLRRLPLYYRELKRAASQGLTHVSSKTLGERVGVPAVQVRKDMSYLDQKGRPGVGYEAQSLAAHLRDFLGLASEKQAVLVGVGNLGRALALYPGFHAYGLRIVGAFDNDLDKVGQRVGTLEILPVEALGDIVARLQVRVGIITTPADAAQDIADALVAGGIKGIWNFAPCRLAVPDGVFVKDEDLAVALAVLSHVVEQ